MAKSQGRAEDKIRKLFLAIFDDGQRSNAADAFVAACRRAGIHPLDLQLGGALGSDGPRDREAEVQALRAEASLWRERALKARQELYALTRIYQELDDFRRQVGGLFRRIKPQKHYAYPWLDKVHWEAQDARPRR